MQVVVQVVIDDVEEDADLELIVNRIESAARIIMPFNHIDAELLEL